MQARTQPGPARRAARRRAPTSTPVPHPPPIRCRPLWRQAPPLTNCTARTTSSSKFISRLQLAPATRRRPQVSSSSIQRRARPPPLRQRPTTIQEFRAPPPPPPQQQQPHHHRRRRLFISNRRPLPQSPPSPIRRTRNRWVASSSSSSKCRRCPRRVQLAVRIIPRPRRQRPRRRQIRTDPAGNRFRRATLRPASSSSRPIETQAATTQSNVRQLTAQLRVRRPATISRIITRNNRDNKSTISSNKFPPATIRTTNIISSMRTISSPPSSRKWQNP